MTYRLTWVIDVAPERVNNENANTDIRYQLILHKKESYIEKVRIFVLFG